MKKRKLLALTLVLALCLGLLPTAAGAEEETADDLPRLPTPTALEWNVSYRVSGGSENKITDPGYVAWKTNAEVNCNASVKVYHKGIGDDVFTEATPSWYQGGGGIGGGGGGGASYVREHGSRWILNYLQDRDKKLVPGTYYFTVQTYAEGYQDSEIATSPQWTYTDPGKALPTPSGLTWNGTTLTWTMEGDAGRYDVELYFSETKDDETSIDDLGWLGELQTEIDERELDLDDWFLDYLIGWGELYIYARMRACTADFNAGLDSEWSELSPACHYVDDRSLGYKFIRSNKWTVDPLLEDTYRVETIVSTDGQPTIMYVTESLKDAIAKDSMVLSDSRDYVGHFFAIGDIENHAVSRIEPVRDLQDITGMGDGVITLQNAAYSYDRRTRFIYVDMGWTDGDDPDNMIGVCEPDRDEIAFLDSGRFDPEGFYNANDVNASSNDNGETYSSVRAVVICPANSTTAEYVYVLRTMWWPAPAPGPDQPSQSAQPSVAPSASPEPSASSEPSTTPSAAPSDSPSPSPSTKPSSSGGSSGSRRPAASVTVESPSPSPSQEPVEPSQVPVTPASELFTDVVKGSWYESGVTYVVNKGLFKGMSEGVFSPHTNMTRAMVMTVLARMDGQDTTNAANGPWYTNIMNWAVAKGISDGTMPDSGVTREQLVTLLYRYAAPAAVAGDLTAFVDGASVSPWAQGAMVWAVKQGVLSGKDGARLDPRGTATRAEVATIIQRFVENK